MNRPIKKYTVVAHDAGGAELLSSYIRKNRIDCYICVEGPAVKVFERKLGKLEIPDLKLAITASEQILCGTSWQSDLEVTALSIAHEQNKKTISFLDHWVNYQERFERNGKTILPTEIWVCDTAAKQVAERVFTNTPILIAGNPYLQEMAEEFNDCLHLNDGASKDGRVLYLGENISGHAMTRHGDAMYFGYTEETALNFFIENIHRLKVSIREVVIRPHPSEDPVKYERLLDGFPYNVSISRNSSLVQDILSTEIVVGCSSMALVIATLSGRKVISCLPPGAELPPWPYHSILRLSDLCGETY